MIVVSQALLNPAKYGPVIDLQNKNLSQITDKRRVNLTCSLYVDRYHSPDLLFSLQDMAFVALQNDVGNDNYLQLCTCGWVERKVHGRN